MKEEFIWQVDHVCFDSRWFGNVVTIDFLPLNVTVWWEDCINMGCVWWYYSRTYKTLAANGLKAVERFDILADEFV